MFDANDVLFHQFSVWQDVNQNGVSEAGEVLTLEQLGIVSINLTSDGVVAQPADGVTECGRTTAELSNGGSLPVADVAFAFTPVVQPEKQSPAYIVI